MPKKTPHNILFLPRWYPSKLDPQLGVFIRKHAEALGDLHKVSVIYPQANSAQKKEFTKEYFSLNGVDTFLVYYPHREKGIFKGLKNAFLYYRAFQIAWKDYKQTHSAPELIHVHVLLRPLLMARIKSLGKNWPIMITEHWTGYVFGFFQKKPFLYRWLSRKLLLSAKVITVVSPALEEAMKNSGLHHPDYRLLPNVVEVGSQEISKTKQKKDKKFLLSVADLVERNKNIKGVIDVVSKISAKRDDFEYHIIGGGEDEAFLKAAAQKAGLLDRLIFFHGRQDNDYVIRYLHQCDFLIVNSNVETFSVVTAEALACGKPVIATRSGGPEFFMTEQTGLLIEAGNAIELQAAIEHMLEHFGEYEPDLMRQYVSAIFSPKAVGARLSEMYDELI